jgi:molecular chaperone DnaK (HSP70)
VTKSYFTKYDNQRSINIRITQANDPTDDPKWVQIVWDGNLELPSGRPAGQEVKVTFSVDDNGVFQASLVDVESGKETEISLSNLSGSAEVGDDDPDPNKPDIDKFILDDDVNEVDK